MTEKREKPLKLDMSFEEALGRFAATKLDELPDNVKLRKKKGSPKRPQVVEGTEPGSGTG